MKRRYTILYVSPVIVMCVYTRGIYNILQSIRAHCVFPPCVPPPLSFSLLSFPTCCRANDETQAKRLLCSTMRGRRCTFVTSGRVFDNLARTWFTYTYVHYLVCTQTATESFRERGSRQSPFLYVQYADLLVGLCGRPGRPTAAKRERRVEGDVLPSRGTNQCWSVYMCI